MGGRGGQSIKSNHSESSVYDLNSPISTYQGTHYESINSELRNGNIDKHGELIKKLDNLSNDELSGTNYRGASGAYNKILREEYGVKKGDSIEVIKSKLVGKTFMDKGFLSTTKSLTIANQRAVNTRNGKGILFVFNGKIKGINVESRVHGILSGIEQEFIIRRGYKMSISDVKYSKKTHRLIIYINN